MIEKDFLDSVTMRVAVFWSLCSRGNLVVRKTVEKSIAVVKTRSNKCMNDLFSGTFVQVLANLAGPVPPLNCFYW